MIEWIFMVLDLISLSSLSLAHFQIAAPLMILLISAAYLIGKGLIFKDVMSMIDLLCGVYIILVAFLHISSFFYYFVLGWFIYKLISTVAH
ncbi:MAG: hypothetical protein KJ905_01285 [Nanoarchaeota archaeon]|nr:hypothetical protein [Nanoarchaeota archaeon]MBU1501393.1 hypothetical protein [Nanoarchaeota archaeon]MBU2458874.1 hypothetical protein [Nanoarchaeota archaeon]